MNSEFLQNALNPNGIADRLTQPGRELSALMVDNTEKLVNLQLEAVRVYTDIGLSQLRAMVSVSDPESLQRYLASQANVAETVVKRAAEHAETVAGIGNDFANDASRIASENVTSLRDAVSTGSAKSASKPKTTTHRSGAGSGAASRKTGGTRAGTQAKSSTSKTA